MLLVFSFYAPRLLLFGALLPGNPQTYVRSQDLLDRKKTLNVQATCAKQDADRVSYYKALA